MEVNTNVSDKHAAFSPKDTSRAFVRSVGAYLQCEAANKKTSTNIFIALITSNILPCYVSGVNCGNHKRSVVFVCISEVRRCLWTAATGGSSLHPPDDMGMEPRWNYTDREKSKNSEKTFPTDTLSNINHTWNDTGANPDLRGEWPAINSQSHGTAIKGTWVNIVGLRNNFRTQYLQKMKYEFWTLELYVWVLRILKWPET